jgi:5-methylcytosine-specific restriction endonuclease McrA
MILNGRKLVTVLPLSDLYTVYHDHKRLKVFVHKGRECVICDREGVLLLVTQEMKGKRRKLHVDLYTEDFVLMTVDHIVPKAQARKIGWSKQAIERLTNKQTMCDPCNGWKGDKQLSVEEIREILRPNRRNKHTGPELLRQFVENSNIFDRNLPETLAFV